MKAETAISPPHSSQLEAFIFYSRWLLCPINLGLIVALFVYVARFLVDTYHMVISGFSLESEAVMVLLLGLVDVAMVANLLVMIIQGGHQIFIRKFHVEEHQRPQWLDHVDSGILKVKVALSVAGITLIRLLKDFVDIENTPWETISHRMWMHGLCLVSAMAMAAIWRLTHPYTIRTS